MNILQMENMYYHLSSPLALWLLRVPPAPDLVATSWEVPARIRRHRLTSLRDGDGTTTIEERVFESNGASFLSRRMIPISMHNKSRRSLQDFSSQQFAANANPIAWTFSARLNTITTTRKSQQLDLDALLT